MLSKQLLEIINGKQRTAKQSALHRVTRLEEHTSKFIDSVLIETDINKIKEYTTELLARSNDVICNLYYEKESSYDSPEYLENIQLTTNESEVAITDYLESNPSHETVSFETEQGKFIITTNPHIVTNGYVWIIPWEDFDERFARRVVDDGDSEPWGSVYITGYKNYEIDDINDYTYDTAMGSIESLFTTLKVKPTANHYIIKLK